MEVKQVLTYQNPILILNVYKANWLWPYTSAYNNFICYFILFHLFDLYLNGKKVTEIKIYFSSPGQEGQQ